MKTIYITEEQKKKLKKVIAAQDQVGSKVNAGVMDTVVYGGNMCENYTFKNKFDTYYRGYNSKYKNLGVRKNQGIWLTDNIEYAKIYAVQYGEFGKIAEIIVDTSKLNPLSESDFYDMEMDPYYSDETTCKIVKNNGYNCWFCDYYNHNANGLCLINKKPIVKIRILTTEEYDSIPLNENVESDTYKLGAENSEISPYYHINESDEEIITLYHGVNRKGLEYNTIHGGFIPRVCSEGGPKAVWLSEKQYHYEFTFAFDFPKSVVHQLSNVDYIYTNKIEFHEFNCRLIKTSIYTHLNDRTVIETNILDDRLSKIQFRYFPDLGIKLWKSFKDYPNVLDVYINPYIKKYQKLSESKLNESAVDLEYHYTTLQNLISMMATDTFNLTDSKGEEGRKGDYYMSLTRMRSNAEGYGYGLRETSPLIRIELDGRLLNNIRNVDITPYDYIYANYEHFKEEWGDDLKRGRGRTDGGESNEAEDSLTLRDGSDQIVDASNYINRIDILLGNHVDNIKLWDKFLKRIETYPDWGEKMHFFTNMNDFNYQRNEIPRQKIYSIYSNQLKGMFEGRKKVIKNDKGEIVPEKCDKCGGKVVLQIHGEPVYVCKDCGKYFGTMPFTLKENKLNENIEAEDKWNGDKEKLEPLKRLKIVPPVLYHASYKKNRESILKNGIYASVGFEYSNWWSYKGPNGETPDDDELEYLVFLSTKPTTWSDNFYLDTMDIYEIDTKQLDKNCFYLDPTKDLALKGSICYTGNIPPSAIKLYDTKYFGKSVNENIELEIAPEDVDLTSFNIKKKLNPKFWVDEHLDSRIRLKLLDISDDFIEYLGIDPNIVKDIIMTGSLANYNWNEKYSDIDLHVLLDYSDVDENIEFVKQYFMAQKTAWNNEHKDLKIFGFPIEVYVQDINEKHDSSGVYSLDRDKWLREPDRDVLATSKVNKSYIKDKVSEYTDKIDKLVYLYKKSKNDEYKLNKVSEKANALWDEIKNSRKIGFEKSDGKEINKNNIIYKSLRRLGYLDKLYNLKTKTYDKLNSML